MIHLHVHVNGGMSVSHNPCRCCCIPYFFGQGHLLPPGQKDEKHAFVTDANTSRIKMQLAGSKFNGTNSEGIH